MISFSNTLFRALAVLLLVLGTTAQTAWAQTNADGTPGLPEPQHYTLGGITVSGARYLDTNTLIGLTGLKIGDPINVPGEEIGKAIRRLWEQGILGDVSVSIARTEGSKIYLDFNLKERPRLSKFEFTGNSK